MIAEAGAPTARYVVESLVHVRDADGGIKRTGIVRVYVATEERAREIAEGHPSRTWRVVED